MKDLSNIFQPTKDAYKDPCFLECFNSLLGVKASNCSGGSKLGVFENLLPL